MPPVGQLSLPQRGPLFEPQVLKQYMSAPEKAVVPEKQKRAHALKAWVGSIPKQQADLEETALEQGFN